MAIMMTLMLAAGPANAAAYSSTSTSVRSSITQSGNDAADIDNDEDLTEDLDDEEVVVGNGGVDVGNGNVRVGNPPRQHYAARDAGPGISSETYEENGCTVSYKQVGSLRKRSVTCP